MEQLLPHTFTSSAVYTGLMSMPSGLLRISDVTGLPLMSCARRKWGALACNRHACHPLKKEEKVLRGHGDGGTAEVRGPVGHWHRQHSARAHLAGEFDPLGGQGHRAQPASTRGRDS